jgi:nicotinamidase-related amidase
MNFSRYIRWLSNAFAPLESAKPRRGGDELPEGDRVGLPAEAAETRAHGGARYTWAESRSEEETMREGVRLERGQTALLIVDVQERLFAAMDPDQREGMARSVKVLGVGALRLGIPIFLTEQYPKGLGHTLPELRQALGGVEPLVKVAFSCCAIDGFAERLRQAGARAVVVAGLETHVCVLLTALDLMAEGFAVHIPADATASRTRQNSELGLEFARGEGAVVTATETVIFQLLREADTDDFRALAPLLR